MKNRFFIAAFCFASLSIISCKNEESKPATTDVVEEATPQNTEETRNDKLRTLKTGDHTVSFNAIQDWKFDERASQIPPAEKALGFEQIGYSAKYSTKASMATLIYRKGKEAMNLQGAIDGMIGAVTNDPNITAKDQVVKDVTDLYGFPAKLGSGRYVEGGTNPYQYQYKFLVIADGNELYMFLGFFEEIDGFDSKFFDGVLKSVKINK